MPVQIEISFRQSVCGVLELQLCLSHRKNVITPSSLSRYTYGDDMKISEAVDYIPIEDQQRKSLLE